MDNINQIKRLESVLDAVHEPYVHGLLALAIHELKLYDRQLAYCLTIMQDELCQEYIPRSAVNLLKKNEGY